MVKTKQRKKKNQTYKKNSLANNSLTRDLLSAIDEYFRWDARFVINTKISEERIYPEST